MENKSLSRALAAIEALAESRRSLTALQLSRKLKFTRPTVYRILGTLVQHGFATREEDRPSYRLSFKFLDLGQQLLERTDLLEAARPVLRKLGELCGETVHLATVEDGRMVYLDKQTGSGPFCTHSRPGSRVPMHCTGLGKAVLAFLPPRRLRAILAAHGLPGYTPRTIVSPAALQRELARVRRQGYAIDDVEFEAEVRCVAAPVFDHRGSPMAAISVSAPVTRMSLARAHEVGAILCEHLSRVSRAMGWRGRAKAAQPPLEAGAPAARPLKLMH